MFGLALLGVCASTVVCIGGQANAALPDIFLPVLPEIKSKTRIPVLLPAELPSPFSEAKHAIVDKATPDEYAVSVYYELDIGNAGFAASFAASGNPAYSPRELSNVREVKLANGVTGYFRPVSCGGSCAPANLWYKQGAALYLIQLKLLSTLGEKRQQEIMKAVANSAILGGPR